MTWDVSDEESADCYAWGGYLVVRPGDKLRDNRYIIKRKLGFGAFAVVWLAEDTQTNVHVALKICRSDSETREAAKAEIEVLNFTRSHHRQSAHIVALLDHFEHASLAYPGQMHIVLAFELLGPNLLDFLNQHMMRAQRGEVEKGEAGGLPLALVKRFADQILEGTAFLHDLCRHIHTDLKPENLAICIPNIESIVRKELERTRPQSVLVDCTALNAQVEIWQSQPILASAYAVDASPAQIVTFSEEVVQHLYGNEKGQDDDQSTIEDKRDHESSELSITPSTSGSSRASVSHQVKPISISKPEPVPASPSPVATSPRSWSSSIASSFLNALTWRFSPSSRTATPVTQPFVTLSASSTAPPAPAVQFPKPALRTPGTVRSKVKSTSSASAKPPQLSIKLVDFGNAQPMSDHFTGRIQTRQYRAPEVILGRKDWEFKADIWSIACILWEISTGSYLFDPPEDGGVSGVKDFEHFVGICEVLGPEGNGFMYGHGGVWYHPAKEAEADPKLRDCENSPWHPMHADPSGEPKLRGAFDQWEYDHEWALRGKMGRKLLDRLGQIPEERLRKMRYVSLEERLVGYEAADGGGQKGCGMGDEGRGKARAFSAFLLPMLRFQPTKRVRAADQRDHQWLAT